MGKTKSVEIINKEKDSRGRKKEMITFKNENALKLRFSKFKKPKNFHSFSPPPKWATFFLPVEVLPKKENIEGNNNNNNILQEKPTPLEEEKEEKEKKEQQQNGNNKKQRDSTKRKNVTKKTKKRRGDGHEQKGRRRRRRTASKEDKE